jgi:hypothetical protein
MLVYCDTSTLLNNVKRHDDPKSLKELAALEHLLTLRREGRIQMVRSRVALRELERPSKREGWPERMAKLRADYEALGQIAMDEKVLGFHSQFDERGGIANPLVSDVQSEALRDKLVQHGLMQIKKGKEDRSDAEHITQAWANRCDVFLTRDEKTIIKHRPWLKGELPGLKIQLPSEMLADLK